MQTAILNRELKQFQYSTSSAHFTDLIVSQLVKTQGKQTAHQNRKKIKGRGEQDPLPTRQINWRSKWIQGTKLVRLLYRGKKPGKGHHTWAQLSLQPSLGKEVTGAQ